MSKVSVYRLLIAIIIMMSIVVLTELLYISITKLSGNIDQKQGEKLAHPSYPIKKKGGHTTATDQVYSDSIHIIKSRNNAVEIIGTLINVSKQNQKYSLSLETINKSNPIRIDVDMGGSLSYFSFHTQKDVVRDANSFISYTDDFEVKNAEAVYTIIQDRLKKNSELFIRILIPTQEKTNLSNCPDYCKARVTLFELNKSNNLLLLEDVRTNTLKNFYNVGAPIEVGI